MKTYKLVSALIFFTVVLGACSNKKKNAPKSCQANATFKASESLTSDLDKTISTEFMLVPIQPPRERSGFTEIKTDSGLSGYNTMEKSDYSDSKTGDDVVYLDRMEWVSVDTMTYKIRKTEDSGSSDTKAQYETVVTEDVKNQMIAIMNKFIHDDGLEGWEVCSVEQAQMTLTHDKATKTLSLVNNFTVCMQIPEIPLADQ